MFSCALKLYSSDPLTINVEGKRHCAVANLILGPTDVHSCYLSVEYFQGTRSLDEINRGIRGDFGDMSTIFFLSCSFTAVSCCLQLCERLGLVCLILFSVCYE